jgi:ribonuclease VapC
VSKLVLAAPALLALLNEETGAQRAGQLLPGAVISTVNVAEVVTRLAAAGMPDSEIREVLSFGAALPRRPGAWLTTLQL